jgi:hypothetical protein
MTHTDDTRPATPHTPEPWHYETDYSITTIFAPDPTGQDPYGTYVAEIDGQDVGRFASREQHEANARRLCAAVNACQGISTEALERGVIRELREALDYLLTQTVDQDLKYGIGLTEGEQDARAKALAALARATPG